MHPVHLMHPRRLFGGKAGGTKVELVIAIEGLNWSSRGDEEGCGWVGFGLGRFLSFSLALAQKKVQGS